MMFGAKDSRILDFIFSTKIDVVIDRMLHKIMSGDYSDIESMCNTVAKAMEALGLGEGAFKGPVSQHLMTNIMNSLNSGCYNTTKNNIRKAMIIVANLKKQGKQIDDRETRKKYYQAIKSLKLTIKLAAKVYRNRAKIMKGLHCAINEGVMLVESLEPVADAPEILSEAAGKTVKVNFMALPRDKGGRHTAVSFSTAKPRFAVLDGSNRRCGGSVSDIIIDGEASDGTICPGDSGTMMISLAAASAKPGDVIAVSFDRPKRCEYTWEMMYALYFGIKDGKCDFPKEGISTQCGAFRDKAEFMDFVEGDMGHDQEIIATVRNDIKNFTSPSIRIGDTTFSEMDIRKMNGDIICVVAK